MNAQEPVTVAPLTLRRWSDLEALFGPRGACQGCWCMYWRLSGGEHDAAAGAGTRAMLHQLALHDPAPGLLAYRYRRPVGWCAVAPRHDYSRILRSPTLRPVDPDERGVWSVSCFYTHPPSGAAALHRYRRPLRERALHQHTPRIEPAPRTTTTAQLDLTTRPGSR